MDIVNTVIQLASKSKYYLLFIIYLIEGPIAGYVSAIVAATGKLDILTVSILLFIAEFGIDVVYYYLGKNISKSKFGKLVKESDNEILKELDLLIKKSFPSVITILKITGVLAVPGILYIGNTKLVKDKTFIIYAFLLCLLKDGLILISGYYTGLEISRFLEIYQMYKVVGLIIIVLAVALLIFRAYEDRIKEFLKNLIKNKV